MNIWGIVLAGGQGNRLKDSLPEGQLKQFLLWRQKPLFWHAAKSLAALAALRGLVFVFPQDELARAEEALKDLCAAEPLGLPQTLRPGGKERQDSVACGLKALPPECTHVLIHDAARPFASPALTQRVFQALKGGAAGAVPGLVPADTIKQVEAAPAQLAAVSATQGATPSNAHPGPACAAQGLMARQTLPRAGLRAIQTPQGFNLAALLQAHKLAGQSGLLGTDDAALLEACGFPVMVVEGESANLKITGPEDLKFLQEPPMRPGAKDRKMPCVGFGYDVHRYGGKRPFILGGVMLNTPITIDAHSDGDTLLHALMDALLGCIGAGDIGRHFPDSDQRFDNINSSLLLAEVLEKTNRAGLEICNVDLTVVAQEPRISPVREEIVKKIAKLLQIPESCVNLKGTTEEHLGFTGEKKGIKAMAAVMGLRPAAL